MRETKLHRGTIVYSDHTYSIRNMTIGKRYINKEGSTVVIFEGKTHRNSSKGVVRYEKSGRRVDYYDWTNFYEVVDTNELENKMKEEAMSEDKMQGKLFQVMSHVDAYGTGLAVNSKGKFILEMKASGGFSAGELFTTEKENLKEVLPYSVRVKFITGSGQSDKQYDYLCEEGKVEVGDVIFLANNNSIVVVTKVNTESRLATKELKGSIIKADGVL